MKYRIGFPVDGGTVDLSYIVIVRTCEADLHSCKEGGNSELQPESGAAYVFQRLPEEVTKDYRYEFELIPKPESQSRFLTPKNIINYGASDAVACALSVFQYISGKKPDDGSPLLLFSCSFMPQKKNKGMKGLILKKVTKKNKTEALESLKNKFEAACRNKAIAMILHEEDAALLSEEYKIEKHELAKGILIRLAKCSKKDQKTYIISCKSEQLPQLAEELEINSSFFKDTCVPSVNVSKKSKSKKKGMFAISFFLVLLVGLYYAIGFDETPQSDRTQQSDRYVDLGIEHYNQGSLSEAKKAFEKSIELDSKNAYAYGNLANVYYKESDFSKTKELWDKAIEIYPESEIPYFNRAGVFIELRQWENAEKDLKQAIFLAPKFEGAYIQLNRVYTALGSLKHPDYFKQAERVFNQLCSINPQYKSKNIAINVSSPAYEISWVKLTK